MFRRSAFKWGTQHIKKGGGGNRGQGGRSAREVCLHTHLGGRAQRRQDAEKGPKQHHRYTVVGVWRMEDGGYQTNDDLNFNFSIT